MLVYEIFDKNEGTMSAPILRREFEERWNCFLIDAMMKKAIKQANKSGYAFEFKEECVNITPYTPEASYYSELCEDGTTYCIFIDYY